MLMEIVSEMSVITALWYTILHQQPVNRYMHLRVEAHAVSKCVCYVCVSLQTDSDRDFVGNACDNNVDR